MYQLQINSEHRFISFIQMKLSWVVDDFVKRQWVNYKTYYFVVFFSNNSLRGIVLESKFWLRPKARWSQIAYLSWKFADFRRLKRPNTNRAAMPVKKFSVAILFLSYPCSLSRKLGYSFVNSPPPLWMYVTLRKFLSHPDPLVRGTDTDPSVIKQTY